MVFTEFRTSAGAAPAPLQVSPVDGGRSQPSVVVAPSDDLGDAVAPLNQSIRRFQQYGDPAALHAVMAEYDWVAVACARRLQRRGEPIEDLEQVAREAIIGAAARFDCERGVPFKSFAWATAAGALRHHYRSRWQVRVPRSLQEMHLATVKALAELSVAGGREATVDEIAAHLRVDREEVILGLDVRHAYLVESLDQPPCDEGTGGAHRALGAVDTAIEGIADRLNIRELLENLPTDQRTALTMYYFDGRTQSEVGEALGVSQAQVSRMMRSALAALRISLS
jgi:RNA polymerase sigma-B factor